MEIEGVINIEEPQFALLAKDIMEIVFEAKYKGEGQSKLYY